MRICLDLEAQIAHALEVSVNEVLAVLLAFVKDALIAHLLGFWARTAWLERLAIFANRELTRMGRGSLDRFGHGRRFGWDE